MKEFIKYSSIKNDFKNSWEIPYDILLNTIEWRKFREVIINRDNNTCTKCNKIQSEKVGNSYITKINEEELKEILKIEPIDVLGDGSILWKSKPAEVIGTVEDNPIILHVHHLYYIYGRLPWEYKTESLITVCHKCHFEIHKNELIPVYTDETLNTKVKLTPCKRCCGTGFLEQFIYYQNGICFQCDGRKFEK